MGTMAWTQGPRASSSGATRTEAAPALYRDRCHLPPFLCSLRGRRLGQLPLAVNNSGSCTVNSLPQRITSGHCISKGLPSDPPRPPRGLSQQHDRLVPGKPVLAAIREHLLQPWGPGLGRCHLPPLPTGIEYRARSEHPAERSLSHP